MLGAASQREMAESSIKVLVDATVEMRRSQPLPGSAHRPTTKDPVTEPVRIRGPVRDHIKNCLNGAYLGLRRQVHLVACTLCCFDVEQYR